MIPRPIAKMTKSAPSDPRSPKSQAVIAPNGMFTVARKVSGKIVPTAPVAWLPSDAVEDGME